MEANATKVFQVTRLFRRTGLTIRLHLIACFVLIVVLMIAADLIAVWQYQQIDALAQRASKTDQISYAVVRVHLDVDTFRDSMAALASSHDTRQFSGETASIRQTFLQHVDDAMQMLRATPDIAQDAPISSALETLRVTLLSQLDTAVQLATTGGWNAFQRRLENQIPALIEFSSLLVERVDQKALRQRSKAIEDAQKVPQRFFIIVPIAALLTLLAAAALGWYAPRTITAPLPVLTAAAEARGRGNFQNKVHLRGNNELAVLGNAFNYAAQQLQELYEELRRSERELRDVIEAMPTMVWIAGTDGSNEFGNRRWQEYSGLSHERTVGSGWQDAVHPADLKRHWEKWCASLASGEPFENEVRYGRGGGGRGRSIPLVPVSCRSATR